MNKTVFSLCVTWAIGCIWSVSIFVCNSHSHTQREISLDTALQYLQPDEPIRKPPGSFVRYLLSLQRAKVTVLSNYYKTTQSRTQTAFIITAIQWAFIWRMRSNLWLAQNKGVALKDLFMVSPKNKKNFLEEGSKAYEKAHNFPEETNQESWIYPWETFLLYHILWGSYSPCFHHTLTKMCVEFSWFFKQNWFT